MTTADLVKQLDDGVREVMASGDMRSYLAMQARFHRYSWSNVLLILAQKPEATRVAGFSTWIDLGRHVNRGEHGITILAPVFRRRDESQEAEGAASEEDVRPSPVRFRSVHVFDVSQTSGTPLPEPPCRTLEGESGEARWLLPRLLDFAREDGLTVDMAAKDCGSANGYYNRQAGIIHVADGLAVDQQAKTLAHEIGHHVLGHEGGHGDRGAKEVAAEGTAFVICQHYGMDTTAYSFGYVATWAGSGKEGEQKLRTTLRGIQHAAGVIIERVEEGERQRETENLVDWARALKSRQVAADLALER